MWLVMAGLSSSVLSASHLLLSPPPLLATASKSCSRWLHMHRPRPSFLKFLSTMAYSSSSSSSSPSPSSGKSILKLEKTEEEWRAVLSPEQFRILRQKGTERARTGKYDKHFEDGIYECAGCGTPLYKSTTKFNSGCGWPAFYEGLPGAINQTVDADGYRIEITCAACGGHLGHIFKGEGFPTPTNERHCVNSISLKFSPMNANEQT